MPSLHAGGLNLECGTRQEFVDAQVCQSLLRLLRGVDAELVAGYQFTRITHRSEPAGALCRTTLCTLKDMGPFHHFGCQAISSCARYTVASQQVRCAGLE